MGKNNLYIKLKNLKKEELLLFEYLITKKKIVWILTEEMLLQEIRKLKGGAK